MVPAGLSGGDVVLHPYPAAMPARALDVFTTAMFGGVAAMQRPSGMAAALARA